MSDEQKRKQYDQFGSQAFDQNEFYSNQNPNVQYEDLLRHFGINLGDMFGGMGGMGGMGDMGMNARRSGSDIEVLFLYYFILSFYINI